MCVAKINMVEQADSVTITLSIKDAAALFALLSYTNMTNRFIGDMAYRLFCSLFTLGFSNKIDNDKYIDTKEVFGNLSIKDVKCPNEYKPQRKTKV